MTTPQIMRARDDGSAHFGGIDTLARDLRNALAHARAEAEALRADLTRARREANLDHLTGLPNRRYFEACAARGSAGSAVAMCDIDDFKPINDRHGHQAGDDVLQIVARHLRDALAPHAIVARYGGEEFAALFANTEIEVAAALVDRARTTLAERISETQDLPPGCFVSFSAGIAPWSGEVRETLRLADRALYAAKRAGKNRVVAASGANQRNVGIAGGPTR